MAVLVTSIGEDTIGLRTQQITGQDRWNNDITGPVDQLVPRCLVTPTRATEDEAGRAARVAGAALLAPPLDQNGQPVPLTSDAVVLWPVTSSALVDGALKLEGTAWQVVGDVGDWGDCLEVQLTRSGGA